MHWDERLHVRESQLVMSWVWGQYESTRAVRR
jgi:hypothetical protein